MEHIGTGLTFGSYIAARRKALFLSQAMLLRKLGLSAVIDPYIFNEIEQDRTDPRSLPEFERLVQGLSAILRAEPAILHALAEDFPRAAAFQREYQSRLQQESIAYRARTIRG